MLHGHTLIELALTLALLTILVGVAVRPLSDLRDLAAVLSAREQLIGVITEARATAVARGGARLDIVPDSGAVRISNRGSTVRVYFLGEFARRVAWELPPARARLRLTFDPVGIGRFASATIRFRRGRVTRSVVVSTYGRVRRP